MSDHRPTDLVVRLRAAAAQGQDIYGIHCDIELEAADEIERLRGTIHGLYARRPECDQSPNGKHDINSGGNCVYCWGKST